MEAFVVPLGLLVLLIVPAIALTIGIILVGRSMGRKRLRAVQESDRRLDEVFDGSPTAEITVDPAVMSRELVLSAAAARGYALVHGELSDSTRAVQTYRFRRVER